MAAKVVEDVFVRVGPVMRLQAGGREIRTTAEHPFWAVGRGWLPAGCLEPGMLLLSHDAQPVVVEEVGEGRPVETVYNLRVADWHTYFVGCAEWGFSVWAHNANYEIVYDQASKRFVLVDRATGNPVIHPQAGTRITGKTAGDVEAIIRGRTPGEMIPDISDVAIAPTTAVLRGGYYEVNGFRFSQSYYERLWASGNRSAPGFRAEAVLREGATPIPVPARYRTRLDGFQWHEGGGWEMYYNPTTREVYHLQPINR